jgi:hypothetical protein
MTKRPGPSTRLLCAVVLLNALGIQCATHVIDRGSREKVKSEIVSQEQRLELVSEPTQDNPVVKFRSLEETRYRETFQLTTVFKREPASGLSLGLLGAGAGAFLLSRDMQNRGYPEYAKPTLMTAFAAAGGAVVCYLLPRFDFRKVECTRETRIDLKPLPIDVSIGSKPLASLRPDAQCYANLSLPTYLNDFARGTDHELTIRMRDRPERTIQLIVAASLVDTLYSMRQRQEKLRREEQEADRERLRREEEERRVAEERKGTLIGAFPEAKGIPAGCQSAKIVDGSFFGGAASVLANDIWGSFPELAAKYNTALQKECFLTTAEADSYKAQLRERKAELTRGMYALQISGARVPSYDTKRCMFSVQLGEVSGMVGYGMQEDENRYGRSRAAHVLQGVWFDDLPLQSTTLFVVVEQRLELKVASKALALDIERRRDSLEVWVAFKLTGKVRRLSRPSLPILDDDVEAFPEGTASVVMLIDRGSGEVLWKE